MARPKHINTKVGFNHKFPDCVCVTPSWGSIKGSKAAICFAIVFGEHSERTGFGELRFGIQSGELQLELTNGEVKERDIAFSKEFASKTKISATDEATGTSGYERRQTGEVGVGISATPSIDLKIEGGNIYSTQNERKMSTSYTTHVRHIRANWHPTKPRWVFFPQLRDACLEGRCGRRKYAIVTIYETSMSAKFKFIVKQKNIVFTEAPFFRDAKSINKKRILSILYAKMVGLAETFSEGSLDCDVK